MKSLYVLKSVLLCFWVLVSCSSSHEKMAPVMAADSTSISYEDAILNDPAEPGASQNTIRKAEMRIKVKDVKNSLKQFENLSKVMGGFVEYSNLESSEFATTNKAVSEDSLLQLTEYSVEGSITLRIPVDLFDSAVNAVQYSALFLNYRKTSAEDIGIQYLSNQMKAAVSEKSSDRLNRAITDKGKKIQDISEAEQTAASMADNAIDRKIANLEFRQKVSYSAIQVSLYQAHLVYKEIIPNINLSDFRPSVGSRFLSAITAGWNGLVAFVIFLVNIWPVIVCGLLLLLWVKASKISTFFKPKIPKN